MALTAREVFAETVRTLSPNEQFRLATLILRELSQSEIAVVDRRDAWSEEDQKDLTTASLLHAEARYPEEKARIADLAKRLGFAGQNAMDQVLKMALDALDAKTPHARRKMTAEEMEAEYRFLSAAGRRWREEHPDEYDKKNPPSKVWQEELYDERGIPK